MDQPSLTLYVDSHFHSPWALSVFTALREKNLPFTLQTVDLDAGDARLPPFRDLSLTARVPTLVHGDFVLSESSAIIDYLDDTFSAVPVLPRDPRQRARARQVQAWIRSDLAALRAERDTRAVFVGPITTPLTADGLAAADKLFRVAGSLLNGPHLFDHWCAADTDLALMLNRLVLSGDPVPAKLRDYAAAQWQRPAVQEWLRHVDQAQ